MEYRRLVDAMRTGLRQLGYEEGKSIAIEYRWAEGGYDRLPELAAELVNLNIDVLVTHTSSVQKRRNKPPRPFRLCLPLSPIQSRLGSCPASPAPAGI